MDEQTEALESFVSTVKVKQKRTAVLLTAVSLVLVIAGISLMVYLGKQVKSKIDQVNYLEEQLAQRQVELKAAEDEFRTLSERNYELRHETENAQAQLEVTRREVNDALDKLEQIYDSSSLPPNAKGVLADAISKIRGAESAVSKVETELRATNQTTPPGSSISLSQAISGLFSNDPAARLKAYNVLMDNYSADPALVPELLTYARANMGNQNGIYNTLVVLSHLNKTQLRPHVPEIQSFAREVEPIGPRIKERSDKLVGRLPVHAPANPVKQLHKDDVQKLLPPFKTKKPKT
jgi:DNA repair exonuclease SbcCD ATPase subunit